MGVGVLCNDEDEMDQSCREWRTRGDRCRCFPWGWSTKTCCSMENKYLAPWMAVAMCQSSPRRLCHFLQEVRRRFAKWDSKSSSRDTLWEGSPIVSAAVFGSHPRTIFLVLHAPSPAASFEVEMVAFRVGLSVGRGWPRKMESMACKVARKVV